MAQLRRKLDEMLFGFVVGRTTTDAIFLVRRLMSGKVFWAKNKLLYLMFIGLEKTFKRDPYSVIEVFQP